ncbi:MAG: hypothetical protein ACR2H3_13700 [Acidimicrobiales bacterium]
MALVMVAVSFMTTTPITPTRVSAATTNRVGLVIDVGDGTTKSMCVTFSEPSISGAELLRRADVDAVFSDYGGQGSAVCSLCRTGCPANDCLTCDPNGRYWAYFRAPWGANSYQYSRAGAASTTVRDGDVEAWAWGTGRAPGYVPFGDLCSGPPPDRPAASGGTATTTTSKAAGPSSGGNGGAAPSTTARPSAATTLATGGPVPSGKSRGSDLAREGPTSPAEQDPAGGSGPRSGTNPSADASGASNSAGSNFDISAPRQAGEVEDGSPWGLVVALTVVGGLTAWALVLRRRRPLGRSGDR